MVDRLMLQILVGCFELFENTMLLVDHLNEICYSFQTISNFDDLIK